MTKKFVVIGGAGAMGRITVTDLYHTSRATDEVVIADYDLNKAEALAASFPAHKDRPKMSAVKVNVREPESAARILSDAYILINCAQYQLNLEVMEIALKIPCHYTDLGGLFHYTNKQMLLNDRFEKVRKIAVIGMGAAPGITNILSRLACDELDTVKEIHTRVAGVDDTKYNPSQALPIAYSLKTILEEFSFEPAVFTKGQFTFTKPMSGDVPHSFPKPVGMKRPMFTLHSEVATLPLSFKDKGVREVTFKIAFDAMFLDRVRFLRDLGMASHDHITVMGKDGEIQVTPIDVVNKVAMAQPPAKQVGKMKQYEIVRSVVKGTKKVKGKSTQVTIIADLHTQGIPGWGMGIDVDTGCPPAVCAQMIADGEIKGFGVQAPEIAVDPTLFFKRLKIRKMKVVVQKKSGWSLKV